MIALLRPAVVFVLPFLVAVPAHAAQSAAPLLDSSGDPPDKRTLAIGDAAPDFALPGIDGKTHELAEYERPKCS